MSDVTRLLGAIKNGDSSASNELLTLVYGELRRLAGSKMAQERPGQTLQATALVHEAWLRFGEGAGKAHFANRGHFFVAAGEAMRRILIEAARRKNAARRGGHQALLDIDEIEIAAPLANDELLAVHEALDRLAAHDPQKAELVKLRYFVGLSIEETATALSMNERTVKRHWAYARAWLIDTMKTV